MKVVLQVITVSVSFSVGNVLIYSLFVLVTFFCNATLASLLRKQHHYRWKPNFFSFSSCFNKYCGLEICPPPTSHLLSFPVQEWLPVQPWSFEITFLSSSTDFWFFLHWVIFNPMWVTATLASTFWGTSLSSLQAWASYYDVNAILWSLCVLFLPESPPCYW